jgi:hypothetical protein
VLDAVVEGLMELNICSCVVDITLLVDEIIAVLDVRLNVVTKEVGTATVNILSDVEETTIVGVEVSFIAVVVAVGVVVAVVVTIG